MTDISRKQIRAAALVGITFSLLSCVADLALLYNPEGGYLAGDYAFLQGFSANRMAWGHFLGILFIPLQLVGLLPVYQGLRPMGRKYAGILFLLGVYNAYPGVAYHGSVAFIAESINHPGSPPVESLKVFSEPLAAIFVGGFLLLSLLFVVPVARGKSAFPRWMAFFNPMAIYLILLGLFFAVPLIGNPLLVAGFNFSLAVFFLLSLLTLQQDKIQESA
ncbi:MAG: hypothetical protein H6581_22960 [Bacteroidia bacterium]|nr:hypothetical protein [Bacteroidia bacterium]